LRFVFEARRRVTLGVNHRFGARRLLPGGM
jgi:hypothetical protein